MNQNASISVRRLSCLLAGVLLLALAGPAAAAELYLEQAVAEALANNPRMAEAAATQEAASFNASGARAEFFPKAAAAYGYRSLADAPFVNLAGNKVVVNSKQQSHWEVSLTQPLFTGFAISSQNRLAQLGLETRELESAQTELAVAQAVKRAYFNLLMAMKADAVARAAEEGLAGHAADARRFHAQGLIPLNDLLKSEVAHAEAVQERTRSAAAVRNATSALNILLGRDFSADTTIADIAAFERIDGNLDDLVTEALSKRPDIAVLMRAVDARAEEIRLAKSDYYPRVELTGKYEQDGDDFLATNNDYANQHNASVAIQARWVFFEAGKTRARAARARSEQHALEMALARLKDDIRLQVLQAWLDLSVADKNIGTMNTALGQAREHWRITNLNYRQHITTATEVLDAQTYLTRAETGYYQALYGYGVAAADLDRAVGRR